MNLNPRSSQTTKGYLILFEYVKSTSEQLVMLAATTADLAVDAECVTLDRHKSRFYLQLHSC